MATAASPRTRSSIWSDPGIYIGRNKADEEKAYRDDRHIVTIGPNGSGKTKRALVPALARIASAPAGRKWSCVIADVNDELTQMLEPHFEANGYETVKLAPFGKSSRGFNTISSMAIDDNLSDNMLGNAEATIKATANQHQPHFPQGAQDLWAGVGMYVRLVIENGSAADIRALLSKSTEELQELILADEIEYEGQRYPGILRAANALKWPEMAAKVNRYSNINPSNTELLGIISTALVQSRWLDSRPVKQDLKGPPFSFKVMKERPVVVFLVLPPRRLATQASWLRTTVTSIVQDLMDDVTTAKVPCLIALDEFFAIADGGFDIITKNMAMFRKYSIKLWTLWQDLSQAQKLFGRDGFETFLANAGVVQAFAPQDTTTAEYLSKRTGQTTKQALSLNESRSRQPGSMPNRSETSSLSQIPMPLMLPQDLRLMREGQTLVLSHALENGQALYHLPFPTEIRGLEEIMKRDPSA